MSSHARQFSTLGPSRKRKERDGSSDGFKTPLALKPEPKPSQPARNQPAPNGNRLLAGYLAQEFLTKGTLFGQRVEPGRAEAPNPIIKPKPAAEADQPEPPSPPLPSSYNDVAYLLKVDGAHIPGIVNPTQLGRWLQKRDWSA